MSDQGFWPLRQRGETDLNRFQEDEFNYDIFPFRVLLAFFWWSCFILSYRMFLLYPICENSHIAISCSSPFPTSSLRSKMTYFFTIEVLVLSVLDDRKAIWLNSTYTRSQNYFYIFPALCLPFPHSTYQTMHTFVHILPMLRLPCFFCAAPSISYLL